MLIFSRVMGETAKCTVKRETSNEENRNTICSLFNNRLVERNNEERGEREKVPRMICVVCGAMCCKLLNKADCKRVINNIKNGTLHLNYLH